MRVAASSCIFDVCLGAQHQEKAEFIKNKTMTLIPLSDIYNLKFERLFSILSVSCVHVYSRSLKLTSFSGHFADVHGVSSCIDIRQEKNKTTTTSI